MPAISEPTLDCQGLDVIEVALAAFRRIPQLQAPQAWSIDNCAALCSCEQLAMRRRMTAAPVVRTDLLRRLRRAAEQSVRHCGLAYA